MAASVALTSTFDMFRKLNFKLSPIIKSYKNVSHRLLCSSTQSAVLQSSVTGASLHSLPGYRQMLATPCTPCRLLILRTKSTSWQDTKISRFLGIAGISGSEDYTQLSDEDNQKNVTEQINTSLEKGDMGRLYAVVYIRGLQHKVTVGDIFAVKNNFPPKVGDMIRLEKVLAVGGKDFTMFGQPLLGRDVVKVEATVVEKTMTNHKTYYMYVKRKNWKVWHLYRRHQTMLVINSIQVNRLPHTEEQDKLDDGSSGSEKIQGQGAKSV